MKHSYCWAWKKCCATLGPIGYFPIPGTAATLCTLPFVWIARGHIASEWHYALLIIMLLVGSFFCIERAQYAFPGKRDPSSIVLDECVGTFITFCFVSMNIKSLVIGFILFRFFDIFKLFGIRSCERTKGALGILLDDIVAGFYANILLHLIIRFLQVA